MVEPEQFRRAFPVPIEVRKIYRELGIPVKEEVQVCFPKSTNFIELMPQRKQTRLKRLGWNIPKTIFTEIPYLIATGRTMIPVPCMGTLSWDLKRGVYYRTMVFMRDWVDLSPDIILEDMMKHETTEFLIHEREMRRGVYRISFQERISRQKKVAEETKRFMCKKYGWTEEMYRETVTNPIIRMEARLMMVEERPLIFTGILGFWMDRYVVENREWLREYALLMTPEMRSPEMVKNYKVHIRAVRTIYISLFNFVPELPYEMEGQNFKLAQSIG